MSKKRKSTKNIKKTKIYIILVVIIIVIFGLLVFLILLTNKIYPFVLNKSKISDVIIITDKTEYDKNDIIKINIENKSGTSIYTDVSPGTRLWYIEYLINDKWIVGPGYNDGDEYVQISFQDELRKTGDNCSIVYSELGPLNKIMPGEKISNLWDQKFCHISTKYNGSGMPPAIIGLLESGIYRLTFDYGFKSSIIEPSNYSDLQNIQTVYSNRFVIK